MARQGVSNLARHLQADLLHVLTMPGPTHAPCPVVLTIHDVAFLHVPDTIDRLRALWYRTALPAGLKRADLVLTNSMTTARELKNAYPVESHPIQTTPFGTPGWTLNRTGTKQKTETQPPFLFIGALEPRKNLLRILEATEQLHPQSVSRGEPSTRPILHIVGAPGWRNGPIISKIKEMEAAGLVVHEAHQNRDVLWQRLSSARGLLLPSLHEGFGFPILEAMAAGIPVITSDRGAMKEVAGNAAILVNPEDSTAIAQAMHRVLTEPEMVSSLRELGLVRSRSFDWRETAALTLDAYRWILKHR